MPTYLIEREIPGASELSDDELRGITKKSNDVVDGLNRPYTWRHSYVAGDKVYCVHDAERPEDVRSTRAAPDSPRTLSPRFPPCSTAPVPGPCPSEPLPRVPAVVGRPFPRRAAVRRIRP